MAKEKEISKKKTEKVEKTDKNYIPREMIIEKEEEERAEREAGRQ